AYLFSLSLLAMSALGVGLRLVVGRSSLCRHLGPLMLLVMIALPGIVPSRYGNNRVHGLQPLADTYERLKPYRVEFARLDTVYVGAFPTEMQNYLGLSICQAKG